MKNKYCFILTLLICGIVSAHGQNRFIEENEEEANTKTEETNAVNEPARKPTKNGQQSLSTTRKKQKSDFWQRTRFGGNFGAGFGDFTYVNVSPRMYYQATEKLWTGVGATFIYSKDKYYIPPYDEQFVYGANLFATYTIFDPLFVQAEYEPLRYEQYVYTFDPNGNRYIAGEVPAWQHSVLIGGGISQPIGANGALFISILYNVTFSNEYDNYYNSPFVFRIGFGI